MRKILSVVLLIIVLFSVGFAKGAWPERDRLHKELNLSREQTRLMQTHRENTREQMDKVREAMKAKFDNLNAELAKKSPDKAKVAKFSAELKDLQGKMLDQHIANTLELKKILTEEQFEKMQNFHKKHLQKFDRRIKGKKRDRVGPPPPF